MPDTDDILEPNAASADAASGGEAAAAPAEEIRPAASAAESKSDKLSVMEIVGQALDKVEAGTTETATEGASPAPEQDEEDEEPKPSDAQADAATAKAPAEGDGQEGAQAAEGDLTPAEMAALPKKTQRRIQRLVQERGRFKESHEAYQSITSYMAENRLSGEEVAIGFDLMARLKRGDAQGFLKAVEPYVRNARMAVGEELPDDVRQKVDAGYVDEDTARELARQRASAAVAQSMLRDREQKDQAAQAAAFSTALRDTLNSWDRANASDPDFTAVRPALLAFAKDSFAANPPRSAEEAVKRLNDHWHLLRRPRATTPRPVATSPSSSQSTSRPVVREPRSLLDAIDIGIERAYARGAAS